MANLSILLQLLQSPSEFLWISRESIADTLRYGSSLSLDLEPSVEKGMSESVTLLHDYLAKGYNVYGTHSILRCAARHRQCVDKPKLTIPRSQYRLWRKCRLQNELPPRPATGSVATYPERGKRQLRQEQFS